MPEHYGEGIKIDQTILKDSEYDVVFERMKLEWDAATMPEKAPVMVPVKYTEITVTGKANEERTERTRRKSADGLSFY